MRSYFQSSRNHDAKTRELVKRIADFEFIVVDNEVEALVLESNLIKKHKPRYNILLKDDKQYPHLKMTNEPFPKVVITRKIVRDGASYYGPFLPAASGAKDSGFDQSHVSASHLRHRNRRQTAASVSRISPETLSRAVRQRTLQAGRIQRGGARRKIVARRQKQELADDLEQRMWHFAETQNYELAAKYRDLHKTVLALAEQQKMATTADRDVDIFGFYRERQRLALQLFTMREGRIVGRREFFWEDLDAENFDASEFLGEVLSQYYSTDYVPLEIHVPQDFEDRADAGKGSDGKTRSTRENSRPETRAKARYDRARRKQRENRF